jgi:hypothetical protein
MKEKYEQLKEQYERLAERIRQAIILKDHKVAAFFLDLMGHHFLTVVLHNAEVKAYGDGWELIGYDCYGRSFQLGSVTGKHTAEITVMNTLQYATVLGISFEEIDNIFKERLEKENK